MVPKAPLASLCLAMAGFGASAPLDAAQGNAKAFVDGIKTNFGDTLASSISENINKALSIPTPTLAPSTNAGSALPTMPAALSEAAKNVESYDRKISSEVAKDSKKYRDMIATPAADLPLVPTNTDYYRQLVGTNTAGLNDLFPPNTADNKYQKAPNVPGFKTGDTFTEDSFQTMFLGPDNYHNESILTEDERATQETVTKTTYGLLSKLYDGFEAPGSSDFLDVDKVVSQADKVKFWGANVGFQNGKFKQGIKDSVKNVLSKSWNFPKMASITHSEGNAIYNASLGGYVDPKTLLAFTPLSDLTVIREVQNGARGILPFAGLLTGPASFIWQGFLPQFYNTIKGNGYKVLICNPFILPLWLQFLLCARNWDSLPTLPPIDVLHWPGNWVARPGVQVSLPSVDSFYAQNSGAYGGLPRGHVIRWRHAHIDPYYPVADAFQIFFRTEGSQGLPEGVVTLIMKPLITFGDMVVFAKDNGALNDKCKPSYMITSGAFDASIEGILSFGWVANIPDHEGSRNLYLRGTQGGRILLDAARASYNLQKTMNVNLQKFTVWGYGASSLASSFAAEMAPWYAPDLLNRFAGAASGGVIPSVHKSLDYMQGSSHAGFIIALTVALQRDSPELNEIMTQAVKDSAMNRWHAIKNYCHTDIIANYMFQDVWDYLKIGRRTLFLAPEVTRLIDNETLAVHHEPPKTPLMIYQAAEDQTSNIHDVDDMVNRYCAGGSFVDYYRTGPLLEHYAHQLASIPDALNWFAAVFLGYRPASCTDYVAATFATLIGSNPNLNPNAKRDEPQRTNQKLRLSRENATREDLMKIAYAGFRSMNAGNVTEILGFNPLLPNASIAASQAV